MGSEDQPASVGRRLEAEGFFPEAGLSLCLKSVLIEKKPGWADRGKTS